MIDADAPIETFEEIDSTVLEARRRAERGQRNPVWLIAKRQTAGRGRRGRAWASLEGNLLATYLGPTDHPPADIALLGFATALAIADAIDGELGAARTTLKWPNDVMVDGAKAAGILIDNGGSWLALAFGVNLASSPKQIDQPTTSLAEALAAAAPAPLVFFERLRPHLRHWFGQLQRVGFEPLRAAWLARAHGLGALARVALGEATVEGRLTGLSSRGELELGTPSGRRLIAAGDVIFTVV
ncbi:MAG: biotin--[acetyl-CoA-carboxylase] ligase [Hyphomonadaceae bacterium]|nr:biotin--[acetyl-CoA-carboxylase] ligase [Hyphomonadaceae bacterium]